MSNVHTLARRVHAPQQQREKIIKMGLASADDVPPTAEEAGAAPKLDEVLDDLAMRFVVNCPAEEQESFERLLFQVDGPRLCG